MGKPNLLIFGALAPISTNAAAATIQTALYFKEYATVTIVINDYAKAPHSLPDELNLLRHRDISNLPKHLQEAKRLFILGDNVHSLDTLQLFKKHPAPALLADKSLYRLFVLDLKDRMQWPQGYTTWLSERFGEQADIIGQALIARNRESMALAEEIPLNRIFPDISKRLIPLPKLAKQFPVSFFPDVPTSETVQKETDVALSILTITNEPEIQQTSVHKAVNNIVSLGHNISTVYAHGAECDIEQKIQSADLIVLTQNKRTLPACVPLITKHQKPLLTAGQTWAKPITIPGFAAPHADAEHYFTCAIGAFLTQPKLQQTLNEFSAKQRSKFANLQGFNKARDYVLNSSINCISADTNAELIPTLDTTPQNQTSKPFPSETGQAVTLIGAIPPRKLIENNFPFLAWEKSPRFATPELCQSLREYTGTNPAITLAKLGYEAPILSDSEPGKSLTLETISSGLLSPGLALSFGCIISGAQNVDHIIASNEATHSYHLECKFPKLDTLDDLTGCEAECSLLWELDPIRSVMRYIIIAGVRGQYTVSVPQGAEFTLTTHKETTYLSCSHSQVVETDSNGILVFSLSLAASRNNSSDCSNFLTKSLADYPLNLEWSGYGK